MGLSDEQYYENKARLTGYSDSEMLPTRRVLLLASGHGLGTLAFQKMVIHILCTHPTTATKNSFSAKSDFKRCHPLIKYLGLETLLSHVGSLVTGQYFQAEQSSCQTSSTCVSLPVPEPKKKRQKYLRAGGGHNSQ